MDEPDDAIPDPTLSMQDYPFESCPTRLDRMGPYHRPDVEAALRATRANFRQMSVLLCRKRQAIYDFVMANSDMKAIFDEVRAGVVDEVEQSAFQLALGGDGAMQRFILRTLGKDRGYVERVEQSGPEGGPVRHEFRSIEDIRGEARARGLPDRIFE